MLTAPAIVRRRLHNRREIQQSAGQFLLECGFAICGPRPIVDYDVRFRDRTAGVILSIATRNNANIFSCREDTGNHV